MKLNTSKNHNTKKSNKHTNKDISKNTQTKNAFVIMHFGNNPMYFELELYFCIMLKKYTKNNIIYMYSLSDTPKLFVNYITPFVYKTISFNDNKITNNLNFTSKYTTFNILRTCNYIFAYKLIQYNKICIIESDMIINKNIDNIFDNKTPSIVYYNHNNKQQMMVNYKINKEFTFDEMCKTNAHSNGGIMLFKPSLYMYSKCRKLLRTIITSECIYPNEMLFNISNKIIYNLPHKYNASHHIIKKNNKLTFANVYIIHFNETKYKHLDIIKDVEYFTNKNIRNKMNKSILQFLQFFNNNIYTPNKKKINNILEQIKINEKK